MNYLSAAELMQKNFPPPKFAVPNLIAEGAGLLVGAPKLGKSWLMLNIALAIALGGKALGKVQVAGGDVFYLALEDSERRMQDRLEMVLRGDAPPGNLRFAFDWLPFVDGGDQDLLGAVANWPDCRLIVIDVLARLRGPASDRADRYQADYMFVEKVKTVADVSNIPIVVVHHDRKASADDFVDSVSGTKGLTGAADTVLVLKRSRTQADAELLVTGRDIEEQAHALRFSPEIGTWSLLGDAADWNVSEQRLAIKHALRKTGGEMGPKQIAELSGVGYDVVRHLVATMAEAGQIVQRGRGTYSLHSQVTQRLGEDVSYVNVVNGWDTPFDIQEEAP